MEPDIMDFVRNKARQAAIQEKIQKHRAILDQKFKRSEDFRNTLP